MQDNIEEEFNGFTNNLYYKPGDALTIKDLPLNGFITSSKTKLELSYTFPKSIKNVSVEVTSFSAEARGIKGYINSSGFQDFMAEEYTITHNKVSDKDIRIIIAKSSEYGNIDNNTPINLLSRVTFEFN